MGQRRDPKELQEIKENRHLAKRKESNKGNGRLPSCPRDLSNKAKEIWHQIVPMVAETGVLDRVDKFALAMFCEIYVTWKEAERSKQENGIVQIDEKGTVKARPEVAIAKQAMDQLIRLGGKFGFSPYDRNSVMFDPKKENSKEDDLLC